MKLILIHGRAQEKFEETERKQDWLRTLERGLSYSGLALPADVRVEFPYYGKLLEKLVNEAREQRAEAGETARGGAFLDAGEGAEIEFAQDFLGEITGNIDLAPAERARVQAATETTRGILNWSSVQYLLSVIERHQRLGEHSLRQFTRDVFLYLTVPDIRRQINAVVEDVFDETEPCVVVGHSLGSIVSYLVLKNNPDYPVRRLITVGSPLGLRSVRPYLDLPLAMPQCINGGCWFNAYDDRDYVALHPLDQRFFEVDPPVHNKSDVNNHTDNRHGIEGYLDDPEVARWIYEGLTA